MAPTGAPRWATIPLALGAAALSCSLTGLVWDVAWHIDRGRDSFLFTPPHVMTLAGLAGFGLAGALSILLATLDRAEAGLRRGRLCAPWSGLVIVALAAGSVIGFPLDDLWHATYGIDVTLWSPTHLLMIGGAILSTFAFALLAAEAGLLAGPAGGRHLHAGLAAGMLLGVSILLLEFDYGVPQWQPLYHPVLLALASALALTAARSAIGPTGALRAALIYLAVRGLLALFIAAQHHTVPRAALVLGSALAVEAAYALGRRLHEPARAAAAGIAVGTFGLASEWAWTRLVYPIPWSAGLLPRAWVAVLAAVAGASIGAAAAAVLAGRRPLPAPVLAAALAGAAVALAVPFPRLGPGQPLAARIQPQPVGSPRPVIDRFGIPGTVQEERLTITLAGGDAAGADWFLVVDWQGGGRVDSALRPAGPATYVTQDAVPVGGSWKSMLYLAEGDRLLAAPVAFPVDLEYGEPARPLRPGEPVRFGAAPQLLMSESHGGPPAIARAAVIALVAVTAGWLALLLAAYRAVSRRLAGPAPGQPGAVGEGGVDRPLPLLGPEVSVGDVDRP